MVVSMPVKNCQVASSSSSWFSAFAIPLNSLLFLFRIQAVFKDMKSIVLLFTLLCVAVLGSSLAGPFGVKATYLAVVQSCSNVSVAKFASLGLIASWVYDTLVFIAISTKLMSFSLPTNKPTWKGRLKCFWTGPASGTIARAVLQTGQLYYLWVVCPEVFISFVGWTLSKLHTPAVLLVSTLDA